MGKREDLIEQGRIIVNDDGTETYLPDPAVAEADLQAAIEDGRIVMQNGVPRPTDAPGGLTVTPDVDGEAKPEATKAGGKK